MSACKTSSPTQYPRLSRRLASVAVCGIRGYKGPLWGLARAWSPKSTAPWSQPFRAVRFQEFARQALREAAPRVERAGKIHNEGPGCVQAFRALGSEDAGQSWVVCALPGREPVLVAEPVWQALRAAGAQALRDAGREESDNALSVVGFPVEGISRFQPERRHRDSCDF